MAFDTRVQPAGAVSAIGMLLEVLEGRTCEAVAVEFGVARTAVERRVKCLAMRLVRDVGVSGLHDGSAAFIRRIRNARSDILRALKVYAPGIERTSRPDRILSEQEIAQAAARIRRRSSSPGRDVALFYVLFATGLRPLEVARLHVEDYLHPDGTVRKLSVLPAEASITGKQRPRISRAAG